jgi:hypothetical protein
MLPPGKTHDFSLRYLKGKGWRKKIATKMSAFVAALFVSLAALWHRHS